jgi:hypothetical protein
MPIVAVIWDTFLTMVLRWRDSDFVKPSVDLKANENIFFSLKR